MLRADGVERRGMLGAQVGSHGFQRRFVLRADGIERCGMLGGQIRIRRASSGRLMLLGGLCPCHRDRQVALLRRLRAQGSQRGLVLRGEFGLRAGHRRFQLAGVPC